ncbi:MAG: GNAT family N-acetyltransferase [Acidimicrobiales bacterium]
MEPTPDGEGVTLGGGSASVTVRTGTGADAAAAAHLHAGQISEGFLASLGPGFLTRLYRRVACSDGSFLLVADEHGDQVGFLAGTLDVGTLYRRFLLRDGAFAAIAAAPRLLRAWPRALETLRHGGRQTARGGASAELLAIAVDPRRRGGRVGTLLVERFLGEIRLAGAGAAHVVVGASNRPAIALYERSGFEVAKTFELHPGTMSVLMRWTSDGASGHRSDHDHPQEHS